MIKKSKLTLRDRYLILKRAIILAANPKVSQITFLYKSNGDVTSYSVFEKGTDPTKLMFLYFSFVAGKSSDIESLTKRTCHLLNKIAVAYMIHNKDSNQTIEYTPEPFRLKGEQSQ